MEAGGLSSIGNLLILEVSSKDVIVNPCPSKLEKRIEVPHLNKHANSQNIVLFLTVMQFVSYLVEDGEIKQLAAADTDTILRILK